MNLQQLPNDIHYHIINQMESNNDLINFSKTNKTFKSIINNNISRIKVELFRVNIKLNFNADLNKHCLLCKKFKNLKFYFNEKIFKFNIDRKTNYTIFDTSTVIYFNIFVDNLEEFNYNFLKFFKDNNLCKTLYFRQMKYDLYMYIDEAFIIKIKEDNLNSNKKDILIDNISNIQLKSIDTKLIGVNNQHFKFINILDGLRCITYEIKKIVYINTEMNNILVLNKNIVVKFLEYNSLYYKNQMLLVNTEILKELDKINPNIEKVDNLVLTLNNKKRMANYMSLLQKYLVDNKINIDNIPQYRLLK